MKRLKNNLAVKIAAFVLLQIFLTAAVLSSIAVIFNADMGWYSHKKTEVREDTLQQMAYSAHSQISQYLWGEPSDIEDLKNELIYEENEAIGFGYTVSELNEKGKKDIRNIHSELAVRGDVYKETFWHDGSYEISVYLADPERAATGADIFPQKRRDMYKMYSKLYSCRQSAIAAGCICLAASLFLFIFLMAAAGYGRKDAGPVLKKVPLDLLAVVVGVLTAMLCAAFLGNTGYYDLNANYDAMILAAVASLMGGSILVTGFFTLFAARVKLGSWWRSTVIYQALRILRRMGKKLWKGLKNLAHQLPMLWKTLIGLAVFSC